MNENVRIFSIRNWERFQHYKKRNPPWIRLYQGLLRDRAYQTLSDTSRSHLVGLFLIASQHDNKIPADQNWLRHELCTKTRIDLETLAASGWIEYREQDASNTVNASRPLAEREQLAPKSLSETDSSEQSRSTEAEIQILAYGEFGRCRLTKEQYGKLQKQLNGMQEAYINRFDRWVNEAPEAKAHGIRRRDRHAYESILAWYERDLGEGKIKQKSIKTEQQIAQEIRARHGIH